MQISTRTDIEAPIDFVYSVLSDFESWERAAMRRGADVTRTDKLRAPGIGMGWAIRFRFRGKDREITVRLAELEPGSALGFSGKGRLLQGDMRIELVSLSPKRTRMVLNSDVQPLTLGAKLFVQSMKLAKGRIQTRLNKRMETLAGDLEQRYRAKGRA